MPEKKTGTGLTLSLKIFTYGCHLELPNFLSPVLIIPTFQVSHILLIIQILNIIIEN